MYLKQAQQLEAEGRFREAEQLYVAMNQPNRAIKMFKDIGDNDNMMRLVETHHEGAKVVRLFMT